MKKLLLILFISLGIVGCSETTPQQVKFKEESYEWKKWDCFAYGYAGEFILSIGYIPELEQDGYYAGKLFLKDAESPIDTIYQMRGVQHEWNWEDYKIKIDSDGNGRYWDFSDADKGEMVTSSEVYECTTSDLEKFDKFMESIW